MTKLLKIQYLPQLMYNNWKITFVKSYLLNFFSRISPNFPKGKNTIIGATQVNGHFFNYIFVCLKNHKGRIIVWIILIFWGIFSINCKFYMFKTWHISKMFLHVQNTQTLKLDNPYFIETSFFPTKCAPFLLKIGDDFNSDNYKGKRTWTNQKKNYNQFEHIWFKHVFHLENYGFWKSGLNKSCSYACDKGHECIIYMI